MGKEGVALKRGWVGWAALSTACFGRYSNHYNSSEEVAAAAATTLSASVADAVVWNALTVNSSLPSWLSAVLVNTPSFEIESGFWTEDGRYRQYDNIYAPVALASLSGCKTRGA